MVPLVPAEAVTVYVLIAKAAVTVQSPVIGLVVYVFPDKAPLQPLTDAI